ncbi:indole-3-glycerol phosphate synthase TrpC [Stygiolobus caldivivus]|uniref:Indole-3-glycerol phosphate synthase n=1 Tax=Stygiolobus caldivivus TaxID=2824673 RepID=A0A8D5U8B3_9CREN|nr:indole-3-glycerol phosphate synthase TrpC [Stygiolobus caldivivus]BCU71208.1 indole-3-glycerol-phosphate synthase [Stygiolobus caldivivus]
MPRFLQGWLGDVVRFSQQRPEIYKVRQRPIYSLRQSILHIKGHGKNPIIAEYKRKSPSGFNMDRDIIEYVKFMESNGVAGISVLTEEKFFGGSYKDLEAVTRAVRIPVLMKDFIVTEKQVNSAYSLGADVILLIVRVLTERELVSLYKYAKSYHLDVIVEVTNEEEIEIAVRNNFDIIGVNSRDLASLDLSLEKTKRLLKLIPSDRLKIAESGIRSRDDIQQLKEAGADAFLIGTTLMQDPNKIKELV